MTPWKTGLALATILVGLAACLAGDHEKGKGLAPIKHVVWATKGQWIYGDHRSGTGEAAALRLSAAPGDTIEFRQSHGRHQVFFYLTQPSETELGERIVVDRDFEVVGGAPEWRRLPTPDFRRAHLATPPAKERSTVITIKLKPSFRRPLFFGSIEPREGGGTEKFFGAIYPVLHRAAHVRKPAPADFRFAPGSRVTGPNRDAWDRGLLGRLAPSRPPTIQAVQDKKLVALPPGRTKGEGKDLTPQWFLNLPAYSPAARPWFFAVALDLPPDNLSTVVAVVGGKDVPTEWVALLSNAAVDGRQMVAEKPDAARAMRFLSAVRVAPGPATAEAAKQAFAVGVDIDNDNRRDLVLANGEDDGRLHIAFNRSAARESETAARAPRFEPGPLITPAEMFRRKGIYLVFPFDADFDGWTDLLIAGAGADAVILFNEAPGRITGREGVVLPNTAFAIRQVGLQDLDGDGRADLVLRGAGDTVQTFFSNNDRTFTAAK